MGLQPFAKLRILKPAAWHHGDEAAPCAVDVIHVLARTQFAVGHVRKSLLPATALSVSQVCTWVTESLVLPSVQRNATGTLPSALMVRMNSSCLRSGLCAFECPKVIAGAVRARIWRPRARR